MYPECMSAWCIYPRRIFIWSIIHDSWSWYFWRWCPYVWFTHPWFTDRLTIGRQLIGQESVGNFTLVVALSCFAWVALHGLRFMSCIAWVALRGMHCIDLRCLELRCIGLHCIELHCIELRCIELHWVALPELCCMSYIWHLLSDARSEHVQGVAYTAGIGTWVPGIGTWVHGVLSASGSSSKGQGLL